MKITAPAPASQKSQLRRAPPRQPTTVGVSRSALSPLILLFLSHPLALNNPSPSPSSSLRSLHSCTRQPEFYTIQAEVRTRAASSTKVKVGTDPDRPSVAEELGLVVPASLRQTQSEGGAAARRPRRTEVSSLFFNSSFHSFSIMSVTPVTFPLLLSLVSASDSRLLHWLLD